MHLENLIALSALLIALGSSLWNDHRWRVARRQQLQEWERLRDHEVKLLDGLLDVVRVLVPVSIQAEREERILRLMREKRYSREEATQLVERFFGPFLVEEGPDKEVSDS